MPPPRGLVGRAIRRRVGPFHGMDAELIADGETAYIDRLRNLPPDFVRVCLEPDIARAGLIRSALQLFQVLVGEVSHPVCRIWGAAQSPPLPPPPSQKPTSARGRNRRNTAVAAKQNTGTTFAR